MMGGSLSIAPVLRGDARHGAARLFAGGPLSFSEVLIGAPGDEQRLPVEAAELLWPQARAALRRLEQPRAALPGGDADGPWVLGCDAPEDVMADMAVPLAAAAPPGAGLLLRLRARRGDAATRIDMLGRAVDALCSRGAARERIIVDPGPLFTGDARRAAFDALPGLLHLGAAALADLRGAPPGAMGAAAAMCLDRGALLLQADDPIAAMAARDHWRVWRKGAAVCETVA